MLVWRVATATCSLTARCILRVSNVYQATASKVMARIYVWMRADLSELPRSTQAAMPTMRPVSQTAWNNQIPTGIFLSISLSPSSI